MRTLISLLLGLLLGATPSGAILFPGTSNPAANTGPPGGALQGSGWQLEGSWAGVIGTPIGPQCFITAGHIGGSVGEGFVLAGETYVADRVDRDPNSDLAVWHVTTPFRSWAPLYRTRDEVGKSLVVFGRGTERGNVVGLQGQPHGWGWGSGTGVQRWGTNTVSAISVGPAGEGELLAVAFNLGVSGSEAHLSVGDSGGGVFIQDANQMWRLAGINDSVDGYYATDASGTLLQVTPGFPGLAALFNQAGFYVEDPTGVWKPVSGPGRWYATRISSNLAFIDAACPPSGDPPSAPACSDGFDNDGDGSIDAPYDPGCATAASTTESPRCQDGIDNDLDGTIDFDGGASANHGVPLASRDTVCAQSTRNAELPSCGIGAELALVVGVALRWRARSTRAV